MKPWQLSIRRQLLCWLLAPIMTLWLVGAAITYFLAIDFANSAYDDSLLDSARAISTRLRFQGSQPDVDLPPAALAILKHNDKDEFFYQVLTSDGRLVTGDDSMPEPVWQNISKEADFRDEKIGMHDVRIAAIEIPIPDRRNNEFVVIQVAETLQGREELLNNIVLGVVLPQLILIILSAAAVWLGVARGLKPLKNLQDAVSSRSPSDLRPLAADNAPKEVKPLVIAINELLDRLRQDRQAQKRFVANAAHQLRTPLAGLKTQTELAERYKDPEELRHSLRQVRTSADRATRLVHQLLSLARVEPSALISVRHESVNLNSVARDASKELVPLALAKQIDLGFEEHAGQAILSGDAKSLYEMASNLIENAILYTQKGGKVTVRVEKGPCLVVEDNGPGIPAEERERVFERFYRLLGNNVDGSGLGLAIVREIAQAHEAQVAISPGPDNSGTTVAVQFGSSTKDAFVQPVECQYLRT